MCYGTICAVYYCIVPKCMDVLTKKNFRIFWQIALSDFKLRYNNSLLGYVWTLVKPLVLFAILYVVFSFFMRFPIENYSLNLLLGVMFWNFFVEATSIAMQSFINKAALITKIYFPRSLIVLASTMTSFLTFLLNLVIFFGFFIYSDLSFSWPMLLFPFYLLFFFLFVVGISFMLSVFYVKFRDLQHIWEVLLQFGFWVTPIIYTIQLIPVEYHFYMMLNPISRAIFYTRLLLIHGQLPTLQNSLIFAGMSIGTFALGAYIFSRKQYSLAEHI